MTMEKEKLWDDRLCLEEEVFLSFPEVPEITMDMDVDTKVKNIRELITQFKCDIEYLDVVVNLGTPSKQAVE